MECSVLAAVAGALFNVIVVLAVAPLFQGALRKLTARIQSRQGPPLWQPYYDLLKLLGKDDLESGEVPLFQRFAAYLALACVLAIACFVPLGFRAPLGGVGDAILLIYLLMLSGICTLLAGLASGSTFSLLGTSREMMTIIALDPVFAVAILVGALHSRSFRLDALLDGSAYAVPFPASGIVMLVVMLLAFQAFVGRSPFDISEAETEIMEGPLVEYSGRKLALFKYAQMVKLVVYCGLFVALFAPFGSGLFFPLAFALFWAKAFVLLLFVTLVAATHGRYRIDQALRYYAGFLAASFGALALASYGL
jgi:formate hydrogenlyase subunit 4